jgi:aconitase B
MQKWLDAPELLTADDNAEYAATIEINLDDIKEPILACPNGYTPSFLSCASSMRVGGATQSSVGSADWSFNNCATALK